MGIIHANMPTAQNTPVATDITLRGSGGVENQDIDSTAYDQAITTAGNTGRVRIRNVRLKATGHGIQVNAPNVNDVTIEDCDIYAEKYAILTNANMRNAKIMRILNNNLVSRTADPLELNNPQTGATYDGQRQVIIMGNNLVAEEDGTNVNSGFGIGIANTKEVIATGNIVEKSRLQGLHIEDDQESVIVTGNVFKGSKGNGANLLAGFTGQPVPRLPIVTDNSFVKLEGAAKTGEGIYRVWDANGTNDVNVSNNYVRGFDRGLFIDGRGLGIVESTYVEDCNIALHAGEYAQVRGTMYAKNCPLLVKAGQSAVIDRVVSLTTPTNIMDYASAAGQVGATLKGFAHPITLASTQGGVDNTFNLFKLPDFFKGTVEVRGTFDINRIFLSFECMWDGTNFTSTLNHKVTAGNFGGTVTILKNGAFVAFRVFMGAIVSVPSNLDVSGTYFKTTPGV